ncbi:MAG: MFS transporter, partial [Burkholderiaceae bacterium]
MAPFVHPAFRMLWTVWLAANTCMWMNDVAAAWLMTTLTTSPVMVALVQTASTLPVFLLGLPSGALADILDRRRYLIMTQVWVAITALLLCLAILSDGISAPLLLLLTFLNGIGLAMRMPVYSALLPELVSRPQLPQAMALNGIAMNASRIIGPIIAGALIAGIGTAYVFVLNMVISTVAALVLVRWRREQKVSSLPGERFLGAMRVGVQYVRQSDRMHAVLLRISVFFLQSSALLALLPLIARQMPGGNAGTFTLLLASMGIGAIAAALLMPRLRHRLSRDQIVLYGSLTEGAAAAIVGFAPNAYVASPAMMIAGLAWLSVANSVSVSAQLALPDWVRARGMSIYQMTMMGSSALGAALWGQVATMTSLRTSLILAGGIGAIVLWATRRFKVDGNGEDLTPQQPAKVPMLAEPLDQRDGPVLVMIEYRIDPERNDEFRQVMKETRRSRLQQGALSWELFRDSATPGRSIEYIVDESWVEQ